MPVTDVRSWSSGLVPGGQLHTWEKMQTAEGQGSFTLGSQGCLPAASPVRGHSEASVCSLA